MHIAFYGDDFTGSSDALLQYHRFGLRGRLFFSIPSAHDVASNDLDVIGVAGIARSLPPSQMDAEILPFLRSPLRSARFVQYKICSTFDSSCAIGSIGHVTELAKREGFRAPFPVLAAQPHFGRYTLFANHYAVYGDAVVRLDRHPTMANHPSTPMQEADLRKVLELQGVRHAVSFDITRVRAPDALERLRTLIDEAPDVIVFDALEDEDLVRIGSMLVDAWPQSFFGIGSGGISYSIGSRLGDGVASDEPLEEVERLFIASGSLAPQTAQQIEWALSQGWCEVRIDPHTIDLRDSALDAFAEDALRRHRTSLRGAIVRSTPNVQGNHARVDPSQLGAFLGKLLARVFRAGNVSRAIVCGGDTSSYAARALGAHSLSIAHGFLDIPASVCRLHSTDRAIDGKLLMLKGGQVGDKELFETVRAGTIRSHIPRL